MFVVLKGRRRGHPLRSAGLDEILAGARQRAGLTSGTCHQLRHTCLTRLREAGMSLEAVQAQAGHRSIESTRIYLHLTNDWLAEQYQRATALIDANQAAVAEMLAVQELAASMSARPLPSPSLTGRQRVGRIAARAPRWPTRWPDTSPRLTVLAPNSVVAADLALRQFARWLLEHTDVRAVAHIGRGHVEDYKVWLADQPGIRGEGLSATTQRQRLAHAAHVLRTHHRVGLG